jgi:hypothetical protein
MTATVGREICSLVAHNRTLLYLSLEKLDVSNDGKNEIVLLMKFLKNSPNIGLCNIAMAFKVNSTLKVLKIGPIVKSYGPCEQGASRILRSVAESKVTNIRIRFEVLSFDNCHLKMWW